jgi:hypothetical protein
MFEPHTWDVVQLRVFKARGSTLSSKQGIHKLLFKKMNRFDHPNKTTFLFLFLSFWIAQDSGSLICSWIAF